ncbi:putative cationic amino acid transporter domain protein [Mycobacterium xenopi 4042]|uniref:Putative cationic amino acid transporter domain protein n=1 Tax=Mycobacterium xenopi 4042 TaxID=1299334 RepID=X7YKC2_MYCXE|nr:putative cationic amino acid transporter domain protein [Mycobacterium xenopi 4042]EUA19449.1 putative cationic amino acid transporter domain protein [Mycobacterium xenopi 3993]
MLATLLALGTKLSAHFSAVVTAIKIAVVLLVVIVGAFYIKPANYSPFIPRPNPSTVAPASTSRCCRC